MLEGLDHLFQAHGTLAGLDEWICAIPPFLLIFYRFIILLEFGGEMGGSGPHPAEPQEVQCEVGQGLPEIAVFSSCLSTSSRKDGEIRSEGGERMLACA